MRGAAIALFVVAASGCAPTLYVHDNKNAAEFERDKYECELVATQTAANLGARANPLIISGEIKRCLEIRYGWKVQKEQESTYLTHPSRSTNPPSEVAKTDGRVGIMDEDSLSSLSVGKVVRPFAEPLGLYRAASQSSERVERLTKETTLDIIGLSDEWLEVKTSNGNVGWVKKVWVR